jgi:hypothetical protein
MAKHCVNYSARSASAALLSSLCALLLAGTTADALFSGPTTTHPTRQNEFSSQHGAKIATIANPSARPSRSEEPIRLALGTRDSQAAQARNPRAGPMRLRGGTADGGRALRIAMFTWESMHTIAVGGVSPHVTELAAGLERRGHEVHIFSRVGDGQSSYDVIDGVMSRSNIPNPVLPPNPRT